MPFPLFVRFFLFLLLLAGSFAAQAGTLKGRITDASGQGLPFANIYVKSTATGTVANEDGYYQLQLVPGHYEVVFQFVGYKAKVQAVEITEGTVVRDVVLEPEAHSLLEVEVSNQTEDPAYRIVREAIKKRKYHLNEIAEYTAQAYVKGLQRLTEVPGKVLGFNVAGLEPGIVYLSESVSELHFQAPARMRERMISSKLSGKNRGFSFNKASDMDVNFYRNLIEAGELNERGFVSPIANNALLFYRYALVSSEYEDGRLVHKIRVSPIRRNDPAFTGFIYILDESWRLHSLNLKLTKQNQLEFVDTLAVNQVFAPTSKGPWVMRSQKFTFNIEAFGFKGNGYFLAVYSKYKVRPAYAYKEPETAASAEPEEQEPAKPKRPKPTRANRPKKANAVPKEPAPTAVQPTTSAADTSETITPLPLRKNEVLRVEEDANKRDSAYWASIRPVPLTEEEVKDYVVKDSIAAYRESKNYKDSVDAIRNRISYSNVLFGGYNYRDSYRNKQLSFDPIFRIWQYNTVEGAVANLRIGYTKRYEDRRRWEISPEIRYGFANERVGARVAAEYTYEPKRFSTFAAEGGSFVAQFNGNNPITPFINSVYTLFREQNYLKLYHKDYGRLSWRTELADGFRFSPYAEFANRSQLQNASLEKVNEFSNREFTPNQPVNEELASTAFATHNALTLGFALRYQPGLEYINRPDRKINLDSKYPSVSLHYRRGIPGIANSKTNFDYVALQTQHDQDFGLFGTSSISLTVGKFLSARQLYFMDYKHFEGNRTILAGSFSGFQLLDYYRYSTRHQYFEGHYMHFFNGFFLNKIPLLRRLRWQETATLNYLYTRQAGHYAELGVGIEHIFKLFRADFYTGFQQDRKVSSGVRVGFGF